MNVAVKPPAPYYGSKTRAAGKIWAALGVDVPNYVEPFCGMAGCLLARPRWEGRVETINDAHALIPNVFRAIQHDPEQVAYWCDHPVFEIDLHAVHQWLVEQADAAFVERMRSDPDFFDAKMAGRWVWGKSAWLGSGWCKDNHIHRLPQLSGCGDRKKVGVGINSGLLHKKRPSLDGYDGKPSPGRGVHSASLHAKLPRLIGQDDARDHGVGVHTKGLHVAGVRDRLRAGVDAIILHRQKPRLSGRCGDAVRGEGVHGYRIRSGLQQYFTELAARLRYVRVICGDWQRVLSPAVTTSHGVTGVLLDPPYDTDTGRKSNLYALDDHDISASVRKWCIEHGEDPLLRIVLCGIEGEHDMPEGWTSTDWKPRTSFRTSGRERLWMSPHCLRKGQTDLFSVESTP